MPTPPTPIRRVSHNSLYRRSLSASRSSQRASQYGSADASAPSVLSFLGPALAEFADECETLFEHAQRTAELDETLREFNEGFSAYLYALEMNSWTTWWPQAPTEASFALAQLRAEDDARLVEEAARAAARPRTPPPPALDRAASSATDRSLADQTGADIDPSFVTVKSSGNAGTVKKNGKAKLSAKERKERGVMVEKVVAQLPLMFRGNDPTLRRNMEAVIERLIENEGRGLRLLDLVAPPDLNEAKARKCILALSAAKFARSDNSSGTVLYHWVGLPVGR